MIKGKKEKGLRPERGKEIMRILQESSKRKTQKGRKQGKKDKEEVFLGRTDGQNRQVNACAPLDGR